MNKDNELFSYDIHGKPRLNYSQAIEILISYNYRRYYPNRNEVGKFVYVYEFNGEISVVDYAEMLGLLQEHIDMTRSHDVQECTDILLRESNKLFTDKTLGLLPQVEIYLIKDTKDKAFVFYRNTIVEVTKTDIKEIPYDSLSGVVWKQQIIDRDIKLTNLGSGSCVFEQFISNICGGDKARKSNLELAMGYLIHGYKDPSIPKAVILYDEQLPNSPSRPEGRTGKGLIMQALGKFRKLIKEDGKLFNPKSNFVFQQVGLDTQILCFDDVDRNFPFEKLFSVVSEGLMVEKKYRSKIHIPYSDSPKILVTSNYPIKGCGASNEARRLELYLTHHYSSIHTPVDDFGHILFEEWSDEEWNLFDNYMIKNLQKYLREGLNIIEPADLTYKRLAEVTSRSFSDFCTNTRLAGQESNLKRLYENFIHAYPAETSITQNMFTRWLKEYARHFGLEYRQRKSSGETFIYIGE